MSDGNAPARRRYAFVDSMRGLAACAVMLYHYTGGDMRATLSEALSCEVVHILHGGWLGVQVFFVLSGFVIASTVGERAITFAGAARFALRRQVRLDPPYWFSLALSTLIPLFWRWRLHDHRPVPSLSRVAVHLVYLQEFLRVPEIQPIYWTLTIEVQFYLALVLALALLRPVRAHAAWAILASAAWSLHESMAWHFLHGWFIPHWYLFALGALAWWTRQRPAAFAAFLTLVAWCGVQGRLHDRPEPVAGALTAATLALASRGSGLERWLPWRPTVFLGTVSYGIYLLHPIVGGQVRWHVGRLVNARSPSGALVVTACAVAATVLCAWLLHVVIEKPAISLAARIRWHRD